MRLEKKARVVLTFLLALVMVMAAAVPSFAGADKQGYWGNTEFNKHANANENITITEVNADGDIVWQNIAYCFNKDRGYPEGEYDGSTSSNEYVKLESQDEATWRSLTDKPSYDGDIKDILTKIVFIGYPYDSNDSKNEIRTILKEQCKVSDEYLDDTFRTATQKAIWHVTDGRGFAVPSDGSVPTGNTSAQVSNYIAKVIYERALATAETPNLQVRLWKWPGANKRNQNLLDTSYNVQPKEQRDEVNPDVSISKVNLGGENIEGAQIKILDENNTVVHEYTSGKSDETITVEPGTYTFHEEAAPEGYLAVSDFNFTVARDGTVTLNNVSSNVAKIVDGKLVVTDRDEVPDVNLPKKEGIVVEFSKTDVAGDELPGASMEITGTTEDGTAITPITWISSTETNKVGLEAGTYTLTEKTAPKGYLVAESITFKVEIVNGNAVVTVDGEDKNGKITMVDAYDEGVEEYSEDPGDDGEEVSEEPEKDKTKDDAVQTGDNMNILLGLMAMICSLMSLAGALAFRRN